MVMIPGKSEVNNNGGSSIRNINELGDMGDVRVETLPGNVYLNLLRDKDIAQERKGRLHYSLTPKV